MPDILDLRSCPSQKTVYATREDALEDRRRIRASYERKRLYVYQCDQCGQYHLSTLKQNQATKMMKRWDDQEQRKRKEFPEQHQQGYLGIENLDMIQEMNLHDCDVGLQVAHDGRIWLCVNGVAFIRFKPERSVRV